MAEPTGSAGQHGDHPPHLQHHFDSSPQQYSASKLGMWLLLSTEILLFGGLFVAYAVYRSNHPEVFIFAHQFLDKIMGGINTMILLASSFTMAWGVRAAQLGQRKLLVVLMGLTLLGGFGFLGVKYVEYSHKWQQGLLWGTRYDASLRHGHESEEHTADTLETGVVPGQEESAVPADALNREPTTVPPAATGPAGIAAQDSGEHDYGPEPKNVQMFFAIYFLMTGLHGIHVIIGMALIFWIMVKSARGAYGPSYYTPVDLVGLYWHLVDLIWIFLFPLLYLIG
jgi:cytochrome c oxidase subunit 3